MATYNNQTLVLNEIPNVLQLDVAGNPHCWIGFEKAAYYRTKGLIAWSMQADYFTLHGGLSRMTGEQSKLDVDTIIAIKGKVNSKQLAQMNRVPLSNKTLFRRDHHICAYCGNEFSASELSRDHIIPTSRGGPNVWTNVVAACHSCNKRKDNRTPEEAGMKLIFIPYAPCRREWLILHNRRILSDQMKYLMNGVPKHSRLHS